MKTWILTPQGEKRFRRGHPWAFSNELKHSPKGIQPGDWIELQSPRGEILARGYGNPRSLIAFRALTRSPHETVTDPTFITQRLVRAARYREHVGLFSYSHRLCFSEADGLPGLVVDWFRVKSEPEACVLVVQILTAGMERILTDPLTTFRDALEAMRSDGLSAPDWDRVGVVVRADSRSRELEGLERRAPQVLKTVDGVDFTRAPLLIKSGRSGDSAPVVFEADLVGGQKTGFFLDQSANVAQLLSLLPKPTGAPVRILDLFSYVGQWGAQLARFYSGVPVEVWAVDASDSALSFARANVEREGATVKMVKMDIVEKCGELPKEFFDVVICDPPALIKSKKDLGAGQKAYLKVNTAALKAAKFGGLFLSCSCSQHLGDQELLATLTSAQERSGRTVNWIARGVQGADHPILFEFPQGNYLNSWIGVVREYKVRGTDNRS